MLYYLWKFIKIIELKLFVFFKYVKILFIKYIIGNNFKIG